MMDVMDPLNQSTTLGPPCIITFSTCFYVLKSKFDVSTYVQWKNHLLSLLQTNHFNLVLYTDEKSSKYISLEGLGEYAKKIHIVVKEIHQFHGHNYKKQWIQNHAKNDLLKDRVDWTVNMLWAEKVWFVRDTMRKKYFPETDYYGWCDIGYFRNRPGMDTPMSDLIRAGWPNPAMVAQLHKGKIAYALINNDDNYVGQLYKNIANKNEHGLPVPPILAHQVSVAGGFFIAPKGKVEWWAKTFDAKLQLYFAHDYLVKDDQIVVADCIFSQLDEFTLYREMGGSLDNWFMFQRILVDKTT